MNGITTDLGLEDSAREKKIHQINNTIQLQILLCGKLKRQFQQLGLEDCGELLDQLEATSEQLLQFDPNEELESVDRAFAA
jgi:hypothetical protein